MNTILSLLAEADTDFVEGKIKKAGRKLHIAVTLLDKGYLIDECVEDVMAGYNNAAELPSAFQRNIMKNFKARHGKK